MFDFFEIFMILSSFLLPEKKKKKNTQPTEPTWQIRPPVKQVSFFPHPPWPYWKY